MKIINAQGAVLGRLASYVAKELLKGEEISLVNCDDVLITGNKVRIKKDFQEKREKIGSGQKGPKISRTSEKIVKRCVRGMLPNHRMGRGRPAFKRVKCYAKIPSEFEGKKIIEFEKKKTIKSSKVKEFIK
jgi:large subunit ribosomal protein L13